MSPHDLDYFGSPAGERRKTWERVAVAIGFPALAALLTPGAVDLAWMSAGAGHGNYFWWVVLFPYSVWVARLFTHTLDGIAASMMYLQFPVYGFLIGCSMAVSYRWFRVVCASLTACHLAAVICRYGLGGIWPF